MKKNIFKSRALKHGALATVLTIVFIVVIVAVNAITNILLDRYPLTIDLTADSRFSLTDESINYIEGIEKPVEIIVLQAESNFANYSGADDANGTVAAIYKQSYEILKDYTKNNPKISLRFVDLNQNPTFADAYPKETLTSAYIIVQSELRYKMISVSSLFSVTNYGDNLVQYKSKAEQTMTSAIMYVLDEDPTTVIALNKTSETLPDFMTILGNNTYNVEIQNTLTDEMNMEAQMMILAGQTSDFTEEELDKIDKWLDNNGEFGHALLYVPTTSLADMPNLNDFLKEWGLVVDAGLIAETDSKNIISSNNAFMTIANLQENKYTENVNKSLYYVAPYCHPVNVLWETSQNRNTEVLIATADSAVYVPANANEDENFNVSAQPKSTFNTAARGYRTKYVDNQVVSSSIIVCGSETSMTATLLNHSSLNNGSVALSIVNTAVGSKDDVNILAIDFTSDSITVTSSQVTSVLVILVILIPVIVLALGIVTFFRRRHL